MTKKIKSSLLLLFLVQLLFAQESEWHWQNPYPLPFIDKLHKTLDGRLLIQHRDNEVYEINDDDTFTKLDMNLPSYNYISGQGRFSVFSKKKWVIFAPYVIYHTENGGYSYAEYPTDTLWQYFHQQFIDDKNGIAFRTTTNLKQVVRTENGGKSWQPIYTESLPQSIEMVSKDTLYLLTSGSNTKIMKSVNGGYNWIEKGSCKYCDHIQKVGDNLLLEKGPFVYLSEDDGVSRIQVLSTWDDNISFQAEYKSSIDGNTIIKSNSKLLFKSLDGGYTWNKYDMNFRDLHLGRGHFKDNNKYYNLYSGNHIGVMKLDVKMMEMNPILGEPITHLQSIQKLESGILASASHDEKNSFIRIFTSEDEGYSWNRHQLKLPDDNLYVANAMQLNTDSSMYVLLKNSLYFYKSFIGEYTNKVELDSLNYKFNRNYSIHVDADGKGIIVSHTLDHIYYTEDYFQNFEKIPLADYKFYRFWKRSDGKHWLFGRKIDNIKNSVLCLLNNKELDTCYHIDNYTLFNPLNDDMIIGKIETYPSGMRYSDSEETVFCPALPGYILSIISEDRMIMKNQGLLYVANPQTCEVIENANIQFLVEISDEFKWGDFKFIELQNNDILGYSYEGYLIRRTDNFLDTLLYNSSKEVEYEATTQEYQFIVYPNPTSDWLQVKDMPYGVECRIIDMTGREYMYGKQSLIYTGQYPSGTYIIQFFQDGRLIESQKIVIQ